jgi:hypothetical protein
MIPDKKECILKKNHDYIVIWSYWEGSDDMLTTFDSNYYTPINALNAYRHNIISKHTYFTIMEQISDKMSMAGFEDLELRGSHILLTLNENRNIVLGKEGLPLTRICNFEYIKRIEPFESRTT